MNPEIFPSNLYSSIIEEKEIYYFKKDCPIGIPGHMHVCIKKGGKLFFFVVVSSQWQKIPLRIQALGLIDSTLPVFMPNVVNNFKDISFVDCNNPIEISQERLEELMKLHYIVTMEKQSFLTEYEFAQVLKGIEDSNLVPQNVKDYISGK